MQCILCTSPILCTVYYAVQSPSPRDSSLWEPCIELVRKQRGHLRETKIYIFPFVLAKTIKKFTQFLLFKNEFWSHQNLMGGKILKGSEFVSQWGVGQERSSSSQLLFLGHNGPTVGFMVEGASKRISSNLFMATTSQKYVVSGWKSLMLRGNLTMIKIILWSTTLRFFLQSCT